MPEHLLESKLITDEQWEEYQRLKEENKQLERTIKYLSECINEKDGLLYNYMKENKQLKERIDKASDNLKREYWI